MCPQYDYKNLNEVTIMYTTVSLYVCLRREDPSLTGEGPPGRSWTPFLTRPPQTKDFSLSDGGPVLQDREPDLSRKSVN